MKILFLKGSSRNNVLRIFSDRLANEFSELDGVKVELIDMMPFVGTQVNNLIDLFSPYDVIISFNAIHADTLVTHGGKSDFLFNFLSAKHVCWMVDDVVYHLARLQSPNPNRITLCTSEQHIRTAQSLQFDGLFIQSLAGGTINIATKPHAERAFDVAIAASWMGNPESFWQGYESSLQQAIEETINCLEQAVICNAFPIFTKKLSLLNLMLTDKTLQFILSEIHSYIRKKDRIAIINQLIDSGVSVALIGSGWTASCYEKNNVTIFEDVHYTDIKQLYENAKVVVNLNAENGACERVFDGIESGAMIFSDFSNALYQIFSHDNGVLFYQKFKANESIQLLLGILERGETECLASKAQAVVVSGYTWKHKAIMLYQLLNEINKGKLSC
jgi:hypothetical protein